MQQTATNFNITKKLKDVWNLIIVIAMILAKNDADTVEILASVLLDGGTAVIPCDTIYGLSAVYGKGEAALKTLKGRDANKPFLVLATIQQARSLCSYIPPSVLNAWPAPLTVILPSVSGSTIGIRVPDDEFLVSILESVGSPVYSTSVNISGEPSLLDFDSICRRFGDKVDVLVKGPENQGTVASTLIDATVCPFRLIRQGAFDASSLID